jgi:hypothetical protein
LATPGYLRTVASGIGGVLIGDLLGHLVNPVLVHFGLPALPQDLITSISSGGGAAAADKLTKTASAISQERRKRAMALQVSTLYSSLQTTFTEALQSDRSEAVKDEILTLSRRITDRHAEWRRDLLTNAEFECICKSTYKGYLKVVGAELEA